MASVTDEKDNLNRRKGLPGTYNHDYSGVPTFELEDDRAEKPWQRVPSTALVLVLGVYLLLGYFTQLNEHGMPKVMDETTVSRESTDTFSEEAALRFLTQIVGTEPRVAGTAYHLQKTRDMKALVDGIATQAVIPVRTDWRMATGDFFLKLLTAPSINYYENASNVIALLEGESGFHSNGTIGSTLLVNCHYDSVPYALGASDNAAFCAIMAECLSRMSRRQTKLKHNILFLFNGAEENGLQASHAFLQHEWSRGVVSVINLDAAGMNGKPSVFQVTDPRLLSSYRRSVYRPSAQGVGEFLFSSGIIPSDTDFRVWRDFGGMVGIDIAFTKWAAVYHTRFDRPDLIESGVMQNAGNMMLALLTDAGDNEELNNTIEGSAAVYYDYLNCFLVKFSFLAAIFMDLFVVALGLLSVAYYLSLVGFRQSNIQELMFSVLGRVVAMVAGVVVTAVLVAIMVATTIQMRYLTVPWIVIPLFWLPYSITAVAVSQLYDAWRLKKNGYNRCIRSLQGQAATRLLLAVLLLVLLCVPALANTRYCVAVPLTVMSVMSLVTITVLRFYTIPAWQHLILEIILSIPTVMFTLVITLRLDAMMLPIMARSANDTPDYTVAFINVGLAILVTSTVSGIELLFSRKRLWLVLGVVGAACVVTMFIPFSPYNEAQYSVQRHYWFHTEMVTHDFNNATVSRTSGVLVTKYDPYTTERVLPALSAAGINVNSRTDFTEDCQNKVHCGLPLFRPAYGRYLPKSLFIYTGGPAQSTPAATVTGHKYCVNTNCTYDFVMTGGFHNLLTFWLRDNVNLTSWSFTSEPDVSFVQLDRPVYTVYHSTATYNELGYATLRFSVNLNVPVAQQSSPILDLAHHSHKIHHPEDYTSEYRNILQAMPEYFNIASFLTFRNDYVF